MGASDVQSGELPRRRRLSPWLRLVALLAVSPVLALLTQTLARNSARPVPATYDTLARFLPPGTSTLDIEPSSVRGIYRFEATGADRDYRGEVTEEGMLLWLATPAKIGTLSPDLRHSLLRGSPFGGRLVDRVQVVAYQVATTRRADDSSSVWVYDGMGEVLHEVDGATVGEDAAKIVEASRLPDAVARTISLHLGDSGPTRLQRQVVLGAKVHAVGWQSAHGEQELKVLDNGDTFLLALPSDEPVPSRVLSQVPPGAEVRAMLLETYQIRDPGSSAVKAVLANGVAISPPGRQSVH